MTATAVLSARRVLEWSGKISFKLTATAVLSTRRVHLDSHLSIDLLVAYSKNKLARFERCSPP